MRNTEIYGQAIGAKRSELWGVDKRRWKNLA